MPAGYDPEVAAPFRPCRGRAAGCARAAAGAAWFAAAVASAVACARADPPRSRIPAVPPGCFAGPGAPSPTGALDERGDIVLADGGTGRLAGIAPPPGQEAQWNAALAAALAGPASAPGLQAKAAGASDRWGRLPVEVVAGGRHAAARLVGEGAALVLTGDLPAACTRSLLGLEREARQARRGAWAGGPADAGDAQAMARLAGRYVVASGRVVGIGQSAGRAFLNFGTIPGQSFAAVIAKRALQKLEASGMRWTSLEGRLVAVRGVVSAVEGPRIEVLSPDQIESLD